MDTNQRPLERSGVDLYWLPLGAGGRSVGWNGRIYERLVAAREHRRPCELYHAALEVHLDGVRYVIESAPAWDRDGPDRGVVVEGPVGLAWLGRSRWFRYEVRCWRDGRIPDATEAVGGARPLTADPATARRILDRIAGFPARTWGRDEQHTGDMWNSNSLVAWLLVHSGLDVDRVRPPEGGRAPGWSAGIVAARRAVLEPLP